MFTLFVDTHEALITVALYDGKTLIKKEQESHYSHAKYYVPMIEEILSENNLNVKNIKNIVSVNGPGSFTGLRIGLAVAKTMAYSLDIPIYLISSLSAYLISSNINENKMAVIEDNKGYYISVFDKNNNIILNETYVTELNDFNYKIVEDKLDVVKVINYAISLKPTKAHLVRANYVKKIEVEK